MNLADKWAEFQERVMPDEASDLQVREMRRAFFGGALVMFGLLTDTAENEEDTAVAQIESIHKEVHDFFENDLSKPPG